jgi:nucleotide-binding universal stress UspA family protein
MNPVLDVVREEKSVRFKSILLATDFSDASQKALQYGAALARHHEGRLSVVHVTDQASAPLQPELSQELQYRQSNRELDTLAKQPALQQTRHQLFLRTGPVCHALSQLIREQDVDLLVLGTHGRGGLKKLILGSVAEEMLRLAPCPVMTVGPASVLPNLPVGEFHTILFATDFGPASTKALPYALFLAQDSGAELILLHMAHTILSVPGELGATFYDEQLSAQYEAETRRTSQAQLEALLPAGVKACCAPRYVVDFGAPPSGILSEAEKHNADLIVMGAHPALFAKAAARLPWAVIHELVCRAHCPVLTVNA